MSPSPQNRACDFHRTRLKQTVLEYCYSRFLVPESSRP